LNVTRADMVAAGHSPSVRLFEAAACGVPIVSDVWAGLDRLFRPETEILLAEGTADVQRILEGVGEPRRRAIAEAARAVVLRRHTADARARELEAHLAEATGQHAHRARALNPWPEPRQLPAA
jgi:spore maturation protein CgeB